MTTKNEALKYFIEKASVNNVDYALQKLDRLVLQESAKRELEEEGQDFYEGLCCGIHTPVHIALLSASSFPNGWDWLVARIDYEIAERSGTPTVITGDGEYLQHEFPNGDVFHFLRCDPEPKHGPACGS